MERNFRGTQSALLIAGLALLILGVRIFVGIRFVSPLPQLDDWGNLQWLQRWSNGVHDWGFIFQRNNDHPNEMYLAPLLLIYRLNGYWDARLDFLGNALAHTLYALVAILTCRNLLGPRNRGWITGFIFFLFVIPFAGYRINWGIILPHSLMMLFSLLALHVATQHRESWRAALLAVGLAWLAALNMADGCLAALVISGLTLFRAALDRRLSARDVVLAVACLGLFLSFYFGMIHRPRATGLVEAGNAFLKALAWPLVFSSVFGLLTVVPFAGLGIAQIVSPRFRTREFDFVLGLAVLLSLVALATGVERGDNQNMGMPSGRYTEMFIMVPLVAAVALGALYQGAGRHRMKWAIFASVWMALQVAGFSIHILYRTLPFVARENGEWADASRQALFRDFARGASVPVPPITDRIWWDGIGFGGHVAVAQGKEPLPALTLPMITGFPVWTGSQGNYVSGGYLPSYQPRPALLYLGSFDPRDRTVTDRWLLSAPFRPTAPYITVDLLVDKKARFSNYQLPGLQVVLRDDTTGQRRELLPQLAHAFPFVFRDWELVYASVTPGHDYRIESYSSGLQNWIALAEPFESGRLTPLTLAITQSGKLLCLGGLGLLALAFLARLLEEPLGWREEPLNPPRR